LIGHDAGAERAVRASRGRSAGWRAKVATLIREIEAEYASDHVLGVDRLITQAPDATPSKPLVRSPIPACHAASAHTS